MATVSAMASLLLMTLALILKPSTALMDPERYPPDAPSMFKSVGGKPRTHGRFRNCHEILREGGIHSDGLYVIYPYDCCPQRPVTVFCDMTSEGGGWTVIQRRQDGLVRENFRRTFLEYALGFGHPSHDHWLGLDHVHALTDQCHNQLRIQLEDYHGNRTWAEYEFFHVSDRDHLHVLEAKYYRGNAGDALSYHSGAAFKDLDVFNAYHESLGGWWHVRNRRCNLNGIFLAPSRHCFAGVFWYHEQRCHNFNATTMMIRPN